MKKILALVLIAAVVLCLGSVSVFAESPITAIGDSDSHAVTASYQEGSHRVVYSVEIKWGDMKFTYNDASSGTWNPETHTYDGATAAEWKADNAEGNWITVTNHSNTDLTASLTYAAAAGFEGIEGRFDKTSLNLATAVGTGVNAAPSDHSEFTPFGALDSDTANNTAIGTVTVTLG